MNSYVTVQEGTEEAEDAIQQSGNTENIIQGILLKYYPIDLLKIVFVKYLSQITNT